MMTKLSTLTKVFRSGNSQAVRIPREFQFDAKEVEIFQRGDELVLRKRKAPQSLASALAGIPAVSGDFFANGRDQGVQEERESFL